MTQLFLNPTSKINKSCWLDLFRIQPVLITSTANSLVMSPSPFTWHHTEDSELLVLFPPCSLSVHPFLTRQPFT